MVNFSNPAHCVWLILNFMLVVYNISDGIRISSEVSPGGEAVRVSIQSISGETIFEVSCLLCDQILRRHMSVAGEKFLLVNKASSDDMMVIKK